jgi:hypothetical protein
VEWASRTVVELPHSLIFFRGSVDLPQYSHFSRDNVCQIFLGYRHSRKYTDAKGGIVIEYVSRLLTAVDISSWDTFTSLERKIAIARSVRSIQMIVSKVHLL